uniref:Tyrosine specific protein phosphatases domain-containing protein n=1 Tax=viral metagenome TaxID=1070528 RepID=A0A6C0JPW9_9ZZZZ
MSYIISNLFVGDIKDVNNSKFLSKNNIQSVLNVSFENYKSPYAKYYKKISMSDSNDEKIWPNLKKALEFLDEQTKKKRNVIVHCSVGMSRSVSIVIGYLILNGIPYESALKLLKTRRPISNPNPSFKKQLKELSEKTFQKVKPIKKLKIL